MKKIILLMFIFISYIITNNNIFADYNISDTSITISKQSNITCKTGSDNVKVCYPYSGWTYGEGDDGRVVAYPYSGWTYGEGDDGRVVAYPYSGWTYGEGDDGRVVAYPYSGWTYGEGDDGRVVAYPSGKESTKGILYSSEDLYISLNLNELELLKKLEDTFNDSEKYEEYLLYYIINNKYDEYSSIIDYTNSSNNNNGISSTCKTALDNLNRLYKESGDNEYNIPKLREITLEYKKNLDIARSFEICLTTYIKDELYYYNMGLISEYDKKYNEAIKYFTQSLKYTEIMLKEDGLKCENDLLCKRTKIKIESNTEMLNSSLLVSNLEKSNKLCKEIFGINSYSDGNINEEGNYDCYCLEGYSWNNNSCDKIESIESDNSDETLLGIDYYISKLNGNKYGYVDYLSDLGIINKKENIEDYNLDKNVLRQEIAAVAIGVAGISKKDKCNNYFSDVSQSTPNTWACNSIEALLDAGLIAKNNYFKPESSISKAEAVGMMIKAKFKNEYSYNSNNSDSWQKQVVDYAVSKGLVENFSDYNSTATRGFVFEVGANAKAYSNK